MTFSSNNILERCFADRVMLIETMTAEIEQIVLKGRFCLSGGCIQNAVVNNSRVSSFRSEEPNTLLDTLVAIH